MGGGVVRVLYFMMFMTVGGFLAHTVNLQISSAMHMLRYPTGYHSRRHSSSSSFFALVLAIRFPFNFASFEYTCFLRVDAFEGSQSCCFPLLVACPPLQGNPTAEFPFLPFCWHGLCQTTHGSALAVVTPEDSAHPAGSELLNRALLRQRLFPSNDVAGMFFWH